MRTRQGPHKNEKAPAVPDVSLCVVTHFTDDPYHKDRYDVVRLSLESMLKGATVARELIIWDNGSVPAFRTFLREFAPDVLIESINVGIYSARRALCSIARSPLVMFADDDILYHPRWLEKQFQVMTTYPNVAVVSGSPINYEFKRNFQPAWDFSQNPEVTCEIGRNLIPDQWERDFNISIGKGDKSSSRIFTELAMTYRGVKVWAHGHHMQMLCPCDVIQPFLKPSINLMDACNIADEISAAGYLQLTTSDRTAVHIGNVIDGSVERIAREWGVIS